MSREGSAAGTSLWAAPERANSEDQAGKGHWEFSGYFPNLMDRLGPWEAAMTPSWVPDSEGLLLHHEVVSRLNGAGRGRGDGPREEGGRSTFPPSSQHIYGLTHVYTPPRPRHRCP